MSFHKQNVVGLSDVPSEISLLRAVDVNPSVLLFLIPINTLWYLSFKI